MKFSHKRYSRFVLVIGCVLVLASFVAAMSVDQKEIVDLIVKGEYVVTMNNDGDILENGAVAINGGTIVAIGASELIESEFSGKLELTGKGRVLMPGLVNGHTHAAMTLLRGIADDLALIDWLNNHIFPVEIEFVDAEFVRIGTELACWEMVRGGTTTFVDMYYFPDAVAAAAEQCGMRALVSATVIGSEHSPYAASVAEAIQLGSEFVERWKGKNSRIKPLLGPHANYTLTPDELIEVRSLAQKHRVPIHIHVAESQFESEYARETFGLTSVHFFDSIDFFAGPTIAAHVVWPNAAEIKVLAARRVGVIHNPTSNMKLASGVSPVVDMIEAGVQVGLGTDGAASNNDLDMWEEMRLAALLQKVTNLDPEVLSADTVLRMATTDGARAIGLGDSIGSLEVGKRADVIQVAIDDVHFIPTYDVISHLVYVADEQDVVSVVVDGVVLMRDNELLTIDTDQVAASAAELVGRIKTSQKKSE